MHLMHMMYLMHLQTIALRSSTAIRDKVMWPAFKNAFGMLGRLRDEGAMLSCIENVSVSRFRQGGLFTQERTSFIYFLSGGAGCSCCKGRLAHSDQVQVCFFLNKKVDWCNVYTADTLFFF